METALSHRLDTLWRMESPALIARLEHCREHLLELRQANFIGGMLRHHQHKSTQYMSQWIEEKNRNNA